MEKNRNKDIAVVLGGLTNHGILIRKMQERGYYVILVDYLDYSPAMAYADEHVRISTFDREGIVKLVEERKVKLVINACLEHLNKEIAYIAEKIGLPMMYSYETALNVSEKKRMKTLMRKGKIPTTDFVVAYNIKDLENISLNYPLFVKPADGSGSTAVHKVINKDELIDAYNEAMNASREKAVIIEEEAVGKECNVYCIIDDGKATVLAISEKYSEIRGEDKNTKTIGALFPAVLSESSQRAIAEAAQKIADTFKLNTVPLFMQIKVDRDIINIIEFAARMPGGFGYQNIKNNLNFDYFDFNIDAFLGFHPTYSLNKSIDCSVIHSIYASPCVLDRIEGFEELKKKGIISNYTIYKEKGMRVTDESGNRSKIGSFISSGDTYSDLFRKVDYVFDHLEAFDIEGNKVLRKNLKLNESIVNETAKQE